MSRHPNRIQVRWRTDFIRNHKATLIQDITEYRAIVLPALTAVMPEFASYGLSEEDCFEWIVREEIERVFYLFDATHSHNHWPKTLIHNRVDAQLREPLSRYTTHYLRAPRLYGENNVVLIEVVGPDLWIDYDRSVYQSLI